MGAIGFHDMSAPLRSRGFFFFFAVLRTPVAPARSLSARSCEEGRGRDGERGLRAEENLKKKGVSEVIEGSEVSGGLDAMSVQPAPTFTWTTRLFVAARLIWT